MLDIPREAGWKTEKFGNLSDVSIPVAKVRCRTKETSFLMRTRGSQCLPFCLKWMLLLLYIWAIYGDLLCVLTWIKAFLGRISLLNYTFRVDLGWGRYKFNEFVTCQGTEGVDRQADHQKSWRRSIGHLPTSFHHGKTTPYQNMSQNI